MSDDYLWDGSGEPDPEIQRLEKLLGSLRYNRPTPDFPELPVAEPRSRRFERRWPRISWRPVYLIPTLATIAIAGAIGLWFLSVGPAYEVVNLTGTPRIGMSRMGAAGHLRVGQWLVTDASSRARIQVGDIGEVEVEPNTRIGLLRAWETEHRLSLQRGIIHAFILAPARRFFVNTPSAEAIDLGCSYTLEVDDDGAGILRVTSGWVAFEFHGHESFVPAGAMCLTRTGAGPGTPYQNYASPEFRAALSHLDFDSPPGEVRSAALGVVLREARKQDALTLWHLMGRSNGAERARVYERLADLVPPPHDASREGILAGNKHMLDLWWNELGLGDTEWWRMWERSWPDQK